MSRVSRISLMVLALVVVTMGCVYFVFIPAYYSADYERTYEVEAFLLDSFPVGQVTFDEVSTNIAALGSVWTVKPMTGFI